MVKVALVAPAGTVTLAGTVAAVFVLESVTTAPPAGAGPFNVAVPVREVPPITDAALRLIEESEDCVTVRFALRFKPA